MKRHLNMNDPFLSPSKQPHLIKQEVFNQNRSRSSCTSYLKEMNLSEKDFIELRQALKTIFHYTQSKIIYDHNQLLKHRLTSPYLQQRLNNDDLSFLPLYTNEYFIRNGLLNHNDGPAIHDNRFQSINLSYSNHSKSAIRLSSSSSMMLTSPMNISLPLALLSNQRYLFTALTSNFTSEKYRRSQSNMELNMINDNETESIIVRRNKVQTWKRDNILQQRTSLDHQSSIGRISSTSKDNTEESIGEISILLPTCNKEEGNEQPSEMKTTDELFPMVKVLAPYIIIRDSFQLNPNNERTVQHINHITTVSEKRSLTDVIHPTLITTKRRSLLSPSLSTIDQTLQANNNEQVYQQKKNYLLDEFESVLTQISKK